MIPAGEPRDGTPDRPSQQSHANPEPLPSGPLPGRIRDQMTAVARVSEKKMFGGLAFLALGNMTVGVHGDDLIARIDPEAMDAALAEPGVRPFDMTGRPMRGWILVASAGLSDDELERWIDQARRYFATLPPK